MEVREGVSGSIERDGEIFRREVSQTKQDESALDCRRLWFGSFLAGLFQGRSSGNDGGLKVFSGRWREVLRGCEPLIKFGIASEAAAENPTLQLGKFELLIGS